MAQQHTQNTPSYAGIWLVSFICMGLVLLALCSGAAYSGIMAANETTALARLEHIESVFLLAEARAAADGLEPAASDEDIYLRSYEHPDNSAGSVYENFLLNEMLEILGNDRSFDFSVHSYTDSDGNHLELAYFPTRNADNPENHAHYLLENGVFSKK